MKRILAMIISAAVAVLYATVVFAQQEYYVQSLKAKIMSEPSFKAKVMTEVGKSQKLIASGKEGSWVKVKFGLKEGYIAALLVATHPPIEKQGLIKADETNLKQSVRRRASTYTSAAAARGLAQDDRRRLSRDEKVDYGGLEKMETFTASSEEVSRFMEGNTL